MKLANMLGDRFRETPADCQIISQIFMIRGGYIKQVANGIYTLLPPAKRIMKKIENIIREEMQQPVYSRADIVYWLCRFRGLNVENLDERRRLIDSFVNSVTIFDDHILIAFNYRDGAETVPFSAIESSDFYHRSLDQRKPLESQ